jgi:ribosomal protein S16
VDHWVKNGAQVSDTVTRLIRDAKSKVAAA